MAFANDVAQRVLQSLGLEAQKVQIVTLRFVVNDFITSDVTLFPSKEAIEGVAEALEGRRFKLVEVTEAEAAPPQEQGDA